MATKPILAVGLEIANPTFSIVEAASPGSPAGWSIPGAITAAAIRTGLPRQSHPRAQRFTLPANTASNAVTSYPIHQAKGCAVGVVTPWCVAALIKTSGIAGAYSGVIRFQVQFRDSSGGGIAWTSVKSLTAVGENYSEWTLITGLLATYTLVSAAHHAIARISMEHTANPGGTDLVLDIAFLGFGLYDTSVSYKQLDSYPSDPTMAVPSSQLDRMPDPYNYPRFLSWDGFIQPRVLRMNLDGVNDADRTIVEKVWGYNRGRRWESSVVSNPSGGQWPVLILPGTSTAPHAMYADFDGDLPDWRQWGGLTEDPPYWTLPLQLTERM